MVDLTKEASKKPRLDGTSSDSYSQVFQHFGPLSSIYLKDEDIKELETMSLEEATKASIKASAQLMFHSKHHIDRMTIERARFTRLEGENSSLLKKLKENDSQERNGWPDEKQEIQDEYFA